MKQDLVYRRVVDGLRLAAAPYEAQRAALPDFVHLPDEVILGVDEAFLRQLCSDPSLADEQREALVDYDRFLEQIPVSTDYQEAVAQLSCGPWFQELRDRARAVLAVLGEEVTPPTLDGVIFVSGRSDEA